MTQKTVADTTDDGVREPIVRAWLRQLRPKPVHVLGPEHVVVCVMDGVPVSERRVRFCLVCGKSDALVEAGLKCKRTT